MLKDVLKGNYEKILDDQILSRFVERDAVNVGTTLQPTKEIENVYIKRIIVKEKDERTKSESETETESETVSEPKIRVIKGGPGIGKSTELTNMAFREKINNKNMFAIKMNLLDHTVEFEKNKKFDKDDTVNCLLKSENIKTDFGRRLLQHHLLECGQIVIYLDGYDEVGSAYEESVISFIRFLNNETKVGTIWITTRPHSASVFKREFKPAFYQLLPLDEVHRKEFLQKYWNYTLNANDGREHIEKCVDDLLKAFENSNIENVEELIGVPLQMKMIAELHEDNCKAYLETKGHYKMELISMNVYNLFQEFIKKKFEIYFKEKAKVDKANPSVKRLIENESKQKQKEFQEMAFRLLFPNDFGLLIKCTNEANPIGLLDVGIVKERNNSTVFIHRTFAEYYVAECLAEKLSQDNQNKELIIFLKWNYFGDHQQMLRYFLDNMLTKDLELHKAAIYGDVALAKWLINENELLLLEKDAMGRIALHLACTYSIFSFSRDYHLLFPVDNVLELLISVDCEGTKPMQITTRDILDYTPYFYAAISSDTDHTLALLAWNYCDYHFTNYLDLNEIEMQFKNLQCINIGHYYERNVTVPNISHLLRNSSMVDLCQNNANFKDIKAYFYGSVENMEVCKENDCKVLKSALQSYFTDIFLLKMNDPKYLIEIVEELSKLGTTKKLFKEAIQTKDYAFLLGFTLACPQTAFDLWMQTDCLAFLKESPKRTNEEQEEIFSDNKLKNILVLAIRQLLMNRGVNVLSSINFTAYFKKIVADDYISFEASLRLMNSEDRPKIHAEVKNGLKDAIIIAISEINPCKLCNIIRYRGDSHATFDFKLYRAVTDNINTHEQAAIAYMKHCLEKGVFIGINALLQYAAYFFLDSSSEVQDVLDPTTGFIFQDALGELVQQNLEHTLDQYLSARSRGYPLSVTQHVISQTAWLYGNGIPPFIQIYFEENFKRYNFVDEVCREVKCGNIKDLLQYFIIAEEEQIKDLLEANENEIFKHCAQFKSENDDSEKNVSNELNDSTLFMSDEFVNDIRRIDEFGVCVVNALTRKSPHQISFLNLFFKHKTGEAVLRDADYFGLLKNALTYMNHRLVDELFCTPTFNYQGKCFYLTDDINKCMAMIFKDNISVFNRLVQILDLEQRYEYFDFTRYCDAYKSAVVNNDFERLDGLFEIKTYQKYWLKGMKEGVEVKEYVNYFIIFCEKKLIQGVVALLQFIDDKERISIENFMKRQEITIKLDGVDSQGLTEVQWKELINYLQKYQRGITRGLSCSIFQYVYYCVLCIAASTGLPIFINDYLGESENENLVNQVEKAVELSRLGKFNEFRECFHNSSLQQKRQILKLNDYEILKDAFRKDRCEDLLTCFGECGEKIHRYTCIMPEDVIFAMDEYVIRVLREIQKKDFKKLSRLTEFLSDNNKMELWQKVDYITAFKNALASNNYEWMSAFLTILQSKHEEFCELTEFNQYISNNFQDGNFDKIKELLSTINNPHKSQILNSMNYVNVFKKHIMAYDYDALAMLFDLYKNEKACLNKVFLEVEFGYFLCCCEDCTGEGFCYSEGKDHLQSLMRYDWTDFRKSEKELEELWLNEDENNRLHEYLEQYTSAFSRGYPWSIFFYTNCIAICLKRSYPIPRCISVYFEQETEESEVNYIVEMRKVIDSGDINESLLWLFLASDEQQKEIFEDKSMKSYFDDIFNGEDSKIAVYLTENLLTVDIFRNHLFNAIQKEDFEYVRQAMAYLSEKTQLSIWKQTNYKNVYKIAIKNNNEELQEVLHHLFLVYNNEDISISHSED